MKTAIEHYHARMQRVMNHIDQHLDGPLDLDALSDIAAFSKFHFHRQFTAMFGISPYRYVQLMRMKRASYRLAFRCEEAVTDIALDAAHETPESFARSFRKQMGQSPSRFRNQPDWDTWRTALAPLTIARSTYMTTYSNDHVKIIDVPETTVAKMEHRGSPENLGTTIKRFIEWRKSAGLSPRNSATFNIFPCDQLTTKPEDFHMELCAETRQPITESNADVVAGRIPSGRCAVLRITGSDDQLASAATFLYRDWLPASGEEARDFPFYCQRVSFFPDVAEHEAVTDLFLPLQ